MSFSDFLAIPCLILLLIALVFLNQGFAYAKRGMPDPDRNALKGFLFAGAAIGVGILASQIS